MALGQHSPPPVIHNKGTCTASRVIQPENVIQHIKATLRGGHQMKHLAELEGVLSTVDHEKTGDEDEHATGRTRGLAIDGGDAVLALLEGQTSQFGNDVGGALKLLAFECQHGLLLIQVTQAAPIVVEG